MEKPEDCVFCTEKESVHHLLFDCVVARLIWKIVSFYFNRQLGSDLESIARLWISNKSHGTLNSVCSAVLWCIWKFRNSFVFNNAVWLSTNQLWWLILQSIQKWKTIFMQEDSEQVEGFCTLLRSVLKAPPPLDWH
ncbi:hypothetical protein BRADI_1g77870v3 [Brachypodium distachyon]|uniref:Reverse transcriptase zinc-binding domain-containing protein n=1 Tax=Brachypodium distachyon TaxID=15368 RepID=A0A2K2DVP0_BRADI|nr:hypothetical protein BRADI_1g77870v3 [Brachypodium distachyon]